MAREELLDSDPARGESPASKDRPASKDHPASKEISAREELLDPSPNPQEKSEAVKDELRPRRLDDFVGQAAIKERLNIMITSAQQRAQPLDHLLFAGPPGLGKTTLSHIIAREMDVASHQTSGPALERTGDLAALLTRLESGDVLFIDEIHRIPRAVEEVLYPAMEDFKVDIILGKGPAARTLALEVAPFTLVAATTRTALITGPLRDRFGLAERLDYYTTEDLSLIVARAAKILDVSIVSEACAEIAKRSRGTPRIANRLLRRVRDYCQSQDAGKVTPELAHLGLEAFGIDAMGLDKLDRSILHALCVNFAGAPVGLTTLAISVSEPAETVEDVYEPFLIQQGFLKRTPKGRVATEKAWLHLGLEPPAVGAGTQSLDFGQ